MSVQRIAVIGAGTMGGGIAIAVLLSGLAVELVDRPEVRERAQARIERYLDGLLSRGRLGAGDKPELLDRLTWRSGVDALSGPEMMIEAVSEDPAVKGEVLAGLPRDFGGLVGTNTSSLSVSALSRFAPDPHRFLGLHFFNPAERMALVEVVPGALTSEETLSAAAAFVRAIGKEPITAPDGPGFIVNRVARPIYLEALRLVGEGGATVEAVDRLVEGMAFPLGPFRLMDLIGIDVNLAVSESVYRQLMDQPRLRPHPLQRRMVDMGRLGRKSKLGFYRYE